MKRVLLVFAPVVIALIAFSFARPSASLPGANGIKWMTWQQMQAAQKKRAPQSVY